jgi:hypothetical protein
VVRQPLPFHEVSAIKDGIVELRYVDGTESPADGLTKALDRPKFKDTIAWISFVKMATKGGVENHEDLDIL